MQLTEIHIDGFGVFCDRHISPLHPGLNVIYGENEFGKTTLLEFIRRTMFGFPDRRHSRNLYPAINGGSYGGRLVCRMKDGAVITINRSGMAKSGLLSISTDDDTMSGQEEFDRLFRMSPLFYQNVYAFTLDELTSLQSLDEQEIHNRIYGAGLELGSLSLSELKGHFCAISDPIYQERSRKSLLQNLEQELKELRKEIAVHRENLPRHLTLSAQLEQLENEIATASGEHNVLAVKAEVLKRRRELYSDVVELSDTAPRLRELESLPNIAENVSTEFERLKTTLATLHEQLEQQQSVQRRLATERNNIILHPKWLELRGEIVALQKKSAVFELTSAAINATVARIEKIQHQLDSELNHSGTGMNADAVRSFQLTLPDKDQADAIRRGLETMRDQKKDSEARLEADINARRAAAVERCRHGISVSRTFSVSFITAGLAAAITGLWQSPYLLGFGLLVMTGGFIALILSLKRYDTATDVAPSPYAADLEHLQSAINEKQQEWRAMLSRLKLPDNISPENFLPVIESLSRAAELHREQAAAQKELDAYRATLQDLHNAVERLMPLLENPSRDVAANIELLARESATQEEASRRIHDIDAQYAELQQNTVDLEKRIGDLNNELQLLLASCHSANEIELRHNLTLVSERRELRNRHELLRQRLRQQLGLNADIDEYVRSLSNDTPDSLNQHYAEVVSQLEQLKAGLDEKREMAGQLKNEIRNLAAQDTLSRLRNREEALKQQMRDAAIRWAAARMALRRIESAAARYERDRQPAVIRQAAELFRDFTGGRYDAIFKPLDQNELLVKSASDARTCSVGELSRGTREELYLAMRLGLIAEYEQHGEPMPLILDDIMVNFDDTRRNRALKSLVSFAATRQAVILTCHRHFLDLCLQAGAHQIAL